MNRAEQFAAVESALMRAHCLSKAMGFMLISQEHEEDNNGSTFRAAMEAVNECAHEAIQEAIDLSDKLANEVRKGDAA